MDMKLDFLRFTCKPLTGVEFSERGLYDWFTSVFPEFLSSDLVTDSEIWTNFQHYDFCLCCVNRLLIYYDSALKPSQKGVNVSIPSGGLWVIKQLFGFDNFVDFLFELYRRAEESHFILRFTRVDICFDDFNYRDEGHYHSAIEFGRINLEERIMTRSHFHNGFDGGCEPTQCCGGRSMGYTFYLGRRGAERMLRIYDKYKESAKAQQRHDHNWERFGWDPDDRPEFVDSVRYEFEIHKGYANNLCWALIECRRKGLTYYFRDFVSDWFRISVKPIDRSNNHQTRDFVDDPKWVSFLNLEFSEEFDKPKLFNLEKKSTSFESVNSWLYKAVLPALAMRYAVDGGFGVLENMVKHLLSSGMLADKYKQMFFEVRGKSYQSFESEFLIKNTDFKPLRSRCPFS